VAKLYTQALGTLSVGSYDSQDYGRCIRTSLHTGLLATDARCSSLHSLGSDRTQNTAPHVVYRPLRSIGSLFDDAIACLLCHNLETAISSGFHVTICSSFNIKILCFRGQNPLPVLLSSSHDTHVLKTLIHPFTLHNASARNLYFG
jgi:hypothetical protein